MTNTDQNFETEWNEKFNHSKNPGFMPFGEAVDSVVTSGFIQARRDPGLDERIDDWIADEHEWLWEWRESLWGLPGKNKPKTLSKLCEEHFVNATKAKYKKELDNRITHFQASFRRRHCIIKMIREMNEKCCRGTGFYSYSY